MQVTASIIADLKKWEVGAGVEDFILLRTLANRVEVFNYVKTHQHLLPILIQGGSLKPTLSYSSLWDALDPCREEYPSLVTIATKESALFPGIDRLGSLPIRNIVGCSIYFKIIRSALNQSREDASGGRCETLLRYDEPGEITRLG
jgi:hypothetical protein